MSALGDYITKGERDGSTSVLLTFRDQSGRRWEAGAVITTLNGPMDEPDGRQEVSLHDSGDLRFTVASIRVVRP